MTHLYIEQNNTINDKEEVASSVVKKLYDLAVEGLDNTSYLKGRLKTTVTSAKYKTYLEGLFPGSLYIDADQYTLSFEDAEVERLCVANWGSNGGVTANQLALVSSTGDVFKNNTDIIKFNEFKYFTNVNTFSFSGCTNLREITLPSNKTSISDYAFNGCANLFTIDLPSSVTEIGRAAFAGCTQLTSVDLSNTQIVSVSLELFKNCSNLQTIKLPTTVTSVGADWFPRKRSLKITGLDNVVSFPENNGEFTNEQLLYPIVYKQFNSKKSIFLTNRNSNPVAHSLYFPKITATQDGANMLYGSIRSTQFGYQSHQNGRARIGLLYYRDLQTIGYATFHNTIIENLIINNNTPPTYNSDVNNTGDTDWADILGGQSAHKGQVTILWVPDNAVSTYQQNPVYSGFTIKGINTKTNGVDYDLPRYADFSAWEAAEEAAVAQGGHAPQGLIESWM